VLLGIFDARLLPHSFSQAFDAFPILLLIQSSAGLKNNGSSSATDRGTKNDSNRIFQILAWATFFSFSVIFSLAIAVCRRLSQVPRNFGFNTMVAWYSMIEFCVWSWGQDPRWSARVARELALLIFTKTQDRNNSIKL
jgi:hypothetical protein